LSFFENSLVILSLRQVRQPLGAFTMTAINKMTMASRYLAAQISSLDKFGFPREKSLNAIKLADSDLSEKYKRFDILTLIPLYEEASKHLNDPYISLRVGFDFRVSTFEQTGNIYTVCDNIRQVVEMNERYQRLAIYAGQPSLEIDDAANRYFLNFKQFDMPSKGQHHIINVIFGAYGTAFRWLNWGSGKGLKSIDLQQPKPANNALFERVFDCPIRFNQPHNRLEFFAEHVDTEFPTRDPLKRAKFEAQLDYLLENNNYQKSFKTALTLYLIQQMEAGAVSFSKTADAFQLSESKLRSALTKSNTNFREQVDIARDKLFRELISQGQTFAAIAQALGYNDQAAFTRAFKRWYGVAPGKWTPDMKRLER
jgi:AraC-like DNA-binding protein